MAAVLTAGSSTRSSSSRSAAPRSARVERIEHEHVRPVTPEILEELPPELTVRLGCGYDSGVTHVRSVSSLQDSRREESAARIVYVLFGKSGLSRILSMNGPPAEHDPHRTGEVARRRSRADRQWVRSRPATARGVLREVAGDPVAGGQLDQRRLHRLADLLGLPAPGVEPAGGRRVERAGHVALQPDALALALRARGSGTGTADSSATVYGCMGRSYRSSRSAISTILPRYMTATRSLMCRTTDRSCAMNT